MASENKDRFSSTRTRDEGIVHSWKMCYGMAVFFRFVILLTSTSFIHPDEHFQNTEIAIDDVFKQSKLVHRSWEWDSSRLPDRLIGGGPVRSILPVGLTSHLGLYLLKFFGTLGLVNISTRSLVIAPRLVLFFLSLLVDRLIFRLLRSPTVQLLYACSLCSLLFACRTFSNSLEAILFTITLLLSARIMNWKHNTKLVWLVIWTLLNVFTTWVRVTYICFALPMALTITYTRLCRSPLVFIAVVSTALLSVTIFISFDSLYFNRWPTVAPISLLAYNLDRQNLAEHGTHPYFLHILVNGPIIFGPAAWLAGWYQIWIELRSKLLSPTLVKLSIASLISGTLLLSLQPHQEARFLLPLGFPLIFLASRANQKAPSKWRRTFWVLHLLHSTLTVILFGYLHQGGLQGALEVLPSDTKSLISYKTFDIPASLITAPSVTQVRNLRGASEETLIKSICAIISSGEREITLIAPRWSLGRRVEERVELRFCSWIPHLDLDRLDQIWSAGILKSGLGLYTIPSQPFNKFLC